MKMTRNFNSVSFMSCTILLLILASCATGPYRPYARESKKKPGVEGVIALKENFLPEDRTFAESIMAKNCGEAKVEINEEGEVVVGTTTKSTSDSRAHEYGYNKPNNSIGNIFSIGPTTNEHAEVTSQTNTQKEWQINYKCVSQIAKIQVEEKESKKVKVVKAKKELKLNEQKTSENKSDSL